MFGTLKKILRFLLYVMLIGVCVWFSVENHTKVELTLFPLPYTVTLPLFLFAIFLLILGMLFGWILSRIEIIKIIKHTKAAHKRILALENELNAVRSERRIR